MAIKINKIGEIVYTPNSQKKRDREREREKEREKGREREKRFGFLSPLRHSIKLFEKTRLLCDR